MFLDLVNRSWHRIIFSLSSIMWCGSVFGDASIIEYSTSLNHSLPLEEISITALRIPQPLNQQGGNLSLISKKSLAQINLTHINEAFFQIPGGWISRGNGQEHLTALRSPVFTGAGACGEFLMAEDLIPLRAAGFCNANQLFDANTEQAERIEVIRGPGTALYGSNAMHGVINIISRAPAEHPETDLFVDSGPHDYTRLKFSTSQLGRDHRYRISANTTHDGGYKDESGFGQQKITLRHDYRTGALVIDNGMMVSNLNQETAGYIQGPDAYRKNSLKQNNPNPEAFRDSQSVRLYSRWQWSEKPDVRYVVTPYLRWTKMAFLQHFLPWQSLEENGQFSIGVQTGLYLSPWKNSLNLIVGIDVEATQGWLKETQDKDFAPAQPEGVHYDYQVNAIVIAPYVQASWSLSKATTVTAGLRAEYTHYEYSNRVNIGSACEAAVANCRFYRPADRSDSFTALSPKLSVHHSLDEQQRIYLNLLQSYRAPQTTELYRLQNGQEVADLDIEKLDSLELGYRANFDSTQLTVAGFVMRKENFIFQDTNRQTISNGKSEHQGIELELMQSITTTLQAKISATYARHRYGNDTAISFETIDGNDIDTAPRQLGQASVEWRYAPSLSGALATLEVVQIGRYFLNPENTNIYDGHRIFNVRVAYPLTPRWALGLRITNLTNIDYAERADYVFGSERYFVGEPRSMYFSISGRF